jgi:uncharacterized protein DUF5916
MKLFLTLTIIILLHCFAIGKELKVNFIENSIIIDGKINVSEWLDSDSTSGFTQLEPQKGNQASEKTIVYVMQNEEFLYVAFKCYQKKSATIVANITSRDKLDKSDDAVMLLLDTFDDQRSGFAFWINPLVTQTDIRINDDGRSTDSNWDTEWQAEAIITSFGWTAEIAIPFHKIGYDESLQTWGINFARIIRQNFETSYWSGLMSQDYRVSQSGKLTNLKLPSKDSDFTLTPYSTLRFENSYETGNYKKWFGDLGLDASYQITSGVVTNVTINPDFATVEGDQEEINLTRWELSFPEKRLFFREGNELYSTRIKTFYSRRIGDIDFGGKITGKVNNYTFSAIGVRTTSDSKLDIAKARFSAFRLKRDILKSSSIGFTAVDKSWQNDYSRSFSTDFLLNPGTNWKLTGQFVTSAPGLSMQHSAYFMRVAHESNLHHLHVRYSDTGKKFRENVNQTGLIREDDMKEIDSDLSYTFWLQSSVFKYIKVDSRNNIFWSHENNLRSWYVTDEALFYFMNKFSLEISYNNEFKLYEKKYYNNKFGVQVGYNTDEWASAEVEYLWGKNFDRDFQLIEFNIQQRLFEKLAIKYSLQKLDFTPDVTKKSTLLNILTLDYNFNRDLWLRLLTQTDDQENRVYFYGLFGWRFFPPFSAIYLIYTTDQFDDLDYNGKVKNEILFVKLSYQFGL